jgi:hypothetical protein
MPTKRRVDKLRRHRISPEAVAAFEAGDYCALHKALGLRPWQASPLPLEVTSLGVDQGPPPDGPTAFAASWPVAQALQCELAALLDERDRVARAD